MDTLKQRLEQLAPTPSSKQEKTSELIRDFNEVILDEEEKHEALRKAREEKFYKLKRIEYMQSLNSPKQFPKYTGDELFELIFVNMDVDDSNELLFRNLAYYFTGDQRGELDLNKGICMFGGVGVGKTTIMRYLSRNQKQSYAMKMCRQVEDEFSSYGDDVLRQYGIHLTPALNSDPFGHKQLGYCFDDLGTEPMSKYYGKETNVMAEVILNRYDNGLAFNLTHLTTNLSIEEIKARYGTRVTDRMKQMFNIVAFDKNAKSRRK